MQLDPNLASLPTQGLSHQEVLDKMLKFRDGDAKWRDGKVFALVYHLNDSHKELLKEAYTMFMSENGLNPMAFKSLKMFEKDIVRMTARMFHGDDETCGTWTSGGTESLMLAVKTYRDRARKKWPWIRNPEIVAPTTIHPACPKGCDYFDIKMKTVKLNEDYTVDVKAIKKAVNKKTIAIFLSAPNYPYGVIDDIEAIGEFAAKKKIPLHVDSCIGGYMLPWVEKLGYNVRPWDFRVPGVTSISADTHKYGYATKGVSTLIYKNMDYLKYQFYCYENWPGGIYASPGFPGTKPGGTIAAAWAAMMAIGEQGYLDNAKNVMKITHDYIQGINSIDALQVFAQPVMTIFSFGSTDPNLSVYAVGDQMEERGWRMDRQQNPAGLHLTINPTHAPAKEKFLADLKESVKIVRENPKLATSGNAAMYGMMAEMPFRGMIKKSVIAIFSDMYSAHGKMPDEKKDGDPENLMELAEKMGASALEAKRQFNVTVDKIKGLFK